MDTISTKNIDYKDRKAVIYVESNSIDELINKWFDEHEIHNLTFKSKAWSYINKKRNAFIAERIHKLLNLDPHYKIVFSHRAGCSCGCSPGFLIKQGGRNCRWVCIDGEQLSHVWVKLDTDNLISAIESHIIIANKKLSKELIANGLSDEFHMIDSMQLMA